MTTPIIENIAVDVASAVDAITTGNGFNQNLVAVRPKRQDWKDVTPVDGNVLIVQGDSEKVYLGSGIISWRQRFELNAIVLDDDDAATSIDTRLNQVRSDIEKKFAEANLITNANEGLYLEGAAKFANDVGHSGITVFIDIQYRVKENDPYTAG